MSQPILFEKNGRIAGLYELSKTITEEDIINAIKEFEERDRDIESYGNSSGYDLIYNGLTYPPKPIFGLALSKAIDFTVTSKHFSGGIGSPCFRRIQKLGFNIEAKKDASLSERKAWTNEELKDSVKTYLYFLSHDFVQDKATKKQFYNELSLKYGRSSKAYEFRMQNISFVFELLGRNWVKGLKPKQNITNNQITLIEKYIAECENKPFENLASFEMEVKQSLDDEHIQKPTGSQKPKQSTVSTVVYERSAKVKAWVLKRAKGVCECCNSPAPFETSDNRPFLEVHHLVRLVDGGSDTPENCVATCPNCHRLLHFGKNKDVLTNQLINRL
ncbi:HNH endonuclease [Vibrio comitans]